MADITDGFFGNEPEVETKKNHVGHATKIFAIHMGILLVVCILIGVFWNMEAMWIGGGFTTFFMVGWHLVAIDKAIQKEREDNYYE
jgi:hypothetical protein